MQVFAILRAVFEFQIHHTLTLCDFKILTLSISTYKFGASVRGFGFSIPTGLQNGSLNSVANG